ncbi:MAG: SDR family NAD(P)-dependent oxidoreductase [Pseudomonadota bacterium]
MGQRRKILITGATGGIGLALVKRLSTRHDILAVGRRSEDEASDLLPENAAYIRADHAEPTKCATGIAQGLLKLGWLKLDNVVLNAGIGTVVDGAVEGVDLIRETLDTNLSAPLLISRALYPWLSKANGTLTLVGSVAHKGQGMFPTYAASKAGLNGLGRALRSEWRGSVNVQVVHPGPTKTEMHAKAGYDPGKAGALFVGADQMAAMLEGAMANGRSPQSLAFVRAWTGGPQTAGRLR